ncbi:hypothetical protein F5887DRAFT_920220 [Amanita rubescens]|nr:hypothetical protein F5887DRAFT_920220 [Amanita rubescens]
MDAQANVCEFLDIEASEVDSAEEEGTVSDIEEKEFFINDEEENADEASSLSNVDDIASVLSDFGSMNGDSEVSAMDSNVGRGVDYRLAAVIDRYEDQASADSEEDLDRYEDQTSANPEDLSINKEVERIAERLMRMPTSNDPGIWRVRVRDGTEQDSFFLLNDRLKVRPQWASSVFLPPASKQWICVESDSLNNVEQLCLNLSTFPHPLQIHFVPVEERTHWLGWRPTKDAIAAPGWVRLKRKQELQDLISQDPKIDPRIVKYANDLAWIPASRDDSLVNICVVPRLAVTVRTGKGDKKRAKRKVLPRLLQPIVVGEPEHVKHAAPVMNPNVWWDPKTRYDFEKIGPGIYQMYKHGTKKPLKNADDFVPPFSFFVVPASVLRSVSVDPKLSELNVFAEGMAIGAKQLSFDAPDPEFMRWTYENHVAAPVEISHVVEVRQTEGVVRGIVIDIVLGEVVVQLDNTQDIAVHPHRVRRIYQIGDTVRVVKGSDLGRQGWVVEIKEGRVGVFDRDDKEQFHVQSWQLVPYDNFEWGLGRRVQVGDTVDVINPLSLHYLQRGVVCNVTDMAVEVMGQSPVMKFSVPHWFLELPATLASHGSDERRLLAYYDRYEELVGTWVWITGNIPEKGTYGRIQKSLGQEMLRVEARTGNRFIDVHVDFLMNEEEDDKGQDLRKYHVGRYETPATKGYRMPRRPQRVPERAATPGAEEPVPPEELTMAEREDNTMAEREEKAKEGRVERLETMDAPRAPSEAAVASNLHQLPPRPPRMISYENQVLPPDWMTKHNLVTKRIWANVRNSETEPFEGGGFARGAYEGERVLILSGEREGDIVVNARQHSIKIPPKFLIPQRPTSKGQDVIVICGEKVGEIYFTRKPNEDGTFPLGRRGYKGSSPLCTIEASRLARCDPK